MTMPPDSGVPAPPAVEALVDLTAFRGLEYTDAKASVIAAFDRDYFTTLYAAARGNVSEMARRSGMERNHIRAKLRALGLHKGGGR